MPKNLRGSRRGVRSEVDEWCKGHTSARWRTRSTSASASASMCALSKLVVGSSSASTPQRAQNTCAKARRMSNAPSTFWPALERPRMSSSVPFRFTITYTSHSRAYMPAFAHFLLITEGQFSLSWRVLYNAFTLFKYEYILLQHGWWMKTATFESGWHIRIELPDPFFQLVESRKCL